MDDQQTWEIRKGREGYFYWAIISDGRIVATGEEKKGLMAVIHDAQQEGCPEDQFPLELVS